jgi:sulfatase maturation enzyme AslB (radical SAM superfamily)
MIPEDMEEKNLVELVRWVRRNTCKEPDYITCYTILTTTDCNARCFYCYEKGIRRLPMSRETADKTVAFIKEHCGEKSVNISWFGGEPLFNSEVIDIIIGYLKENNIKYISTMVTNGYLFDEKLIFKAKNFWNLTNV